MSTEDRLTDIIIDVISSDYRDSSQYNSNTPNDITKVYLDEILDFIKENAKVNVTYAGTITQTGNPDLVVSDTLSIDITNNYAEFTPGRYENWILYIMSMIYGNTWIGKGSYLDKPLLPFHAFATSIIQEIPQQVVRSVYDSNCDENGRLKSDVDISKICLKALITAIFNILQLPYSLTYNTNNIAQTSTGLVTILNVVIE